MWKPYFEDLFEDSDEELKASTTPVPVEKEETLDHMLQPPGHPAGGEWPIFPLTIDPVSVRPAALPLKAT